MSNKTYRVKRIEAIQRATAVLDYLYEQPGQQLKQLHNHLGIAKPTLLRVLATLRDDNYVWQRLSDGAWMPSARHQRGVSLDEPNWMAELASPILETLARDVPWPSQVAVPIDGAMESIESNYSQAFIDPLPPNSIGFRVPILRSASGRAWFCFASHDQQQRVLQLLRERPGFGNEMAADSGAIKRLIKETLSRGYARRDPDFGGQFDVARAESDDRRDTIALPIRVKGHAVASLNFTWKSHVVKIDDILRMHWKALQQAAGLLEQEIDRFLSRRALFEDVYVRADEAAQES